MGEAKELSIFMTTNPFTIVPDELISNIFIYLSPVEIIKSVTLCNKHFYNITSSTSSSSSHDDDVSSRCSDEFWHVYGRIVYPTIESSLTRTLTSIKQIQQCCVVAHIRRLWTETEQNRWFAVNEQHDNRDFDWNQSLFPRNLMLQQSFSSTRHRNVESIANTIPNHHDANWLQIIDPSKDQSREYFFRTNMTWWSSAPSVFSSPKDTNEILLYSTNTKSIITEVAIKPLRDPFFAVGNMYSWPQISINVYSLPQQDDNESIIKEEMFRNKTGCDFDNKSRDGRLYQRPIIESIMEDYTPTYESPIMDAKSLDDKWQWYKVPDGVVGNVVTFTLWGKTSEQYEGRGYYVCAEWVAVRGVPLFKSLET